MTEYEITLAYGRDSAGRPSDGPTTKRFEADSIELSHDGVRLEDERGDLVYWAEAEYVISVEVADSEMDNNHSIVGMTKMDTPTHDKD